MINNATFWDMAGLVTALQSYSTSVSLWQHAYVYNASQGLASPLWDPIMGGGLASSWLTWGGATPDWTLQATRDAVGRYMADNFISSLNVAAFKLDECDGNQGQVSPSVGRAAPNTSPPPRLFTRRVSRKKPANRGREKGLKLSHAV